MNNEQKLIIDDWFNTTNYIYNKTLAHIKQTNKTNFYHLRDLFITNNTKKNNISYINLSNKILQLHNKIKELKNTIKTSKNELEINNSIDIIKLEINDYNKILRTEAKKLPSEKNLEIKDWELKTPKDIRAGAIKEVCDAYKTSFANLKAGNIKFFNLSFRKKNSPNKCITIPKSMIKIKNNNITIAPTYLNKNSNFKINTKTLKKNKTIIINNDCKLIKKNNNYYLLIPIQIIEKEKPLYNNYCGIDPGIRTFMTTFGNNGFTEYKHNNELLKIINNKIKLLKSKRLTNKRKALCKQEMKKENLINELHWKTINSLTNSNDIIFYGNINSHNIVKNNKNKVLNTNTNDLKLYKFKERLFYKANINNILIFAVNEAFTTQTCSCCGKITKVGCSTTFNCSNCFKTMGRDVNASKNILIKGILKYS